MPLSGNGAQLGRSIDYLWRLEKGVFECGVDELLERLRKSLAVRNQLDRALTSIPLNLAKGNGKFTNADRCRFFDIARGSALGETD
jgi:hypothetical protein